MDAERPIEALLEEAEVAAIFRCPPRTVETLRRTGRLNAVVVARKIRFRPEDVRAFLEREANS